jgi:anaerobic selenocysteine-containing dehydrogenase
MTVIKTVCQRDCPDTCFVDVIVENGRIVSTRGSADNPVTQGFLCPRGVGDAKRVYSERRVKYPHVRREQEDGGRFARVAWDEAISLIAEKLRDTIEIYGRESVLLYDYPGNQGFLAWQFPRRLWFALGATTSDYALCSKSGHAGIGLHYGLSYGLQLEDLIGMKVIIFWGNNSKISSPHCWALALRARSEQNATIISVDPRESPTSESCDIWIQPRPGSDVALSYGIARHLILNNGVDSEFVGKWTRGYKEFRDEALKWTPERVKGYTGISWDMIRKVGDLLIANRSAAFMIGLGLQKAAQGAEAARAVSLLPALLGRHRGFHYSDSNGRVLDLAYLNGAGLSKNKGRVVNQVSVGHQMEAGAFKFVFILGTNPAVTLPNQSAVRKGLNRKDVFVVVQDTHWSETTEYADIVLPAPTYLEKRDVNLSDHHLYSRLSRQALEPLGESRHEIWVMRELARKLSLKEKWLFEEPWKALQKCLSNSYQEGDLQDILDGAVLQLKLRSNKEYQTPSGKIEFAASKAAEIGAAALPFQDPIEHGDEWFTLLNSSISKYTHSQFTDVYGPIPQIVWINPKEAANREIRDGDLVEIYNELGSVLLRAKLTEKTSPGNLWAPRPLIGLDGSPLNILAPGAYQKIGGGPIFNSIRVKIKIGSHSEGVVDGNKA